MTASVLESVRGDTFIFSAYVFNNGVQVDISGAAARFTAKRSYADADDAAVVKLDMVAGGVEIANAAGGEFRITVPASATAALDNVEQRLVWDVEMTKGGNTYTIAGGQWLVRPEVSRP